MVLCIICKKPFYVFMPEKEVPEFGVSNLNHNRPWQRNCYDSNRRQYKHGDYITGSSLPEEIGNDRMATCRSVPSLWAGCEGAL